MAAGPTNIDLQPILSIIEKSAGQAAKHGAGAAAVAAAYRGAGAIVGRDLPPWSDPSRPASLPAQSVTEIETRKVIEFGAFLLLCEKHTLRESGGAVDDVDADHAARLLLAAIAMSADIQLVYTLLGNSGASIADREEMRGRVSAQIERARELRQRGRPA